MKIVKTISALALVTLIVMATLMSYKQTGVEAGWKKALKKKALMAALLLHGGKKIVLPFPIPLPIPILKQTQPVYYQQQQQSYSSHGGQQSYYR